MCPPTQRESMGMASSAATRLASPPDTSPMRNCPSATAVTLDLGRAGQSARRYCSRARRSAKNEDRSSEACSASTPGVTGSSWLRRGSAHRLYNDPHAPAFGSAAPNTSPPTRPAMSAPAHIGHGSSVTYRVVSPSRQVPRTVAARCKARISAWAVGSFRASRSLRPRPTMRPPATTTAPTGTSPALPAATASSSASAMASSSVTLAPYRPARYGGGGGGGGARFCGQKAWSEPHVVPTGPTEAWRRPVLWAEGAAGAELCVHHPRARSRAGVRTVASANALDRPRRAESVRERLGELVAGRRRAPRRRAV